MKAKLFFLVLCILMIFASQTRSVAAGDISCFYSGNDLVTLMGEYDKTETGASGADYNYHHVKAREYGAYIVGVCDGTRHVYDIPDGATRGQIVAVVSKYLKDHPEKWSESAVFLVTEALMEAFPLKGGK
jgi:hypothetical protein